jgi:hypothetical protein
MKDDWREAVNWGMWIGKCGGGGAIHEGHEEHEGEGRKGPLAGDGLQTVEAVSVR